MVVSAAKIAERLTSLIDRGLLDQTNKLSADLHSFYNTLKEFCQGHGGHLYLHLYERAVLEIPLSCADELTKYWDGFQEQFHGKAAMGFGFSMAEAAKAMQISMETGNIELYDIEGKYNEASKPRTLTQELPPNLFDPLNPPSEVPPKAAPNEFDVPKRPSPEEEAQAEAQLIQSMMGGPVSPPSGQAAPQGQPQGQPPQQVQPPRSLMEALSGRRDPTPETTQAPEQAEEKEGDEQDVKAKMDQAEEDAKQFNGQLASTIHTVKEQIPQIMGMAESNPKAFQQAMQMISKLLTLSRQRKVGKSEIEYFENLTKQMDNKLWSMFHGKMPVGTVMGGKKKVLVDGKAYWRSVKSGLVQDSKGTAISVKSSNLQAKPGTSTDVAPSGNPEAPKGNQAQ